MGFPGSLACKESTSSGDPSSIPGLGRSPEEGIGYPFQCSWASLVAQLVKNLPAMQETWVWSLGWEDPLEKGKATHSNILAWRIPRTVHLQRVDRTERLSLSPSKGFFVPFLFSSWSFLLEVFKKKISLLLKLKFVSFFSTLIVSSLYVGLIFQKLIKGLI